MAIQLVLAALRSRAVRNVIVNQGVRRIATSATSSITTQGQQGTQSSNIWDSFGRFGGGILKNLQNVLSGNFKLNFTSIWSKISQTVLFVLNFDWNASDASLDAAIANGYTALAGSVGGAFGNALGYAICGGVPAAAMAVFNPALAVHVLDELGENAADEIASHMANVLQATWQQTQRVVFTNIFKNHRNLIRGAAVGVATIMTGLGILSPESVAKANKERDKPWSFNQAIDETIESIQSPQLQALFENLYEEFLDACIEAGYVIAGSLDSYFAQSRVSNNAYFGSSTVVAVSPSRSVP